MFKSNNPHRFLAGIIEFNSQSYLIFGFTKRSNSSKIHIHYLTSKYSKNITWGCSLDIKTFDESMSPTTCRTNANAILQSENVMCNTKFEFGPTKNQDFSNNLIIDLVYMFPLSPLKQPPSTNITLAQLLNSRFCRKYATTSRLRTSHGPTAKLKRNDLKSTTLLCMNNASDVACSNYQTTFGFSLV